MTPTRLQTIEEVFHGALDCEPDQVSTFLDKTCAGDEVLRDKVEALLASHQQAGSFIETPVATLTASIVENGQPDLLIGHMIGHYKISKRIGAGGMGEVYLASDITAGRSAALKLLPTQFTGDAERLKRFQQEARAVAGLNHPNILTVYEVGADNSTRYIASELIEGETLRQRLARGSMQLSEAVEIAIQVAGALAAAHEAGVVHRDVKPENIMLRPDGYVKVLDFGIAKLAEQEVPATMGEEEALLLVGTNLGSILGTVRYMSPEQARGAPVDKRTDIWSLGVMLYEMAVGRTPFTGDTPRDVMAAIVAIEPPPLSGYMAQAPGELQQIVNKALRKNPEERYQNAKEMLEALKGLRHKLEFAAELKRSAITRWIRSPTALALTLLAVALALAFPSYWLRKPAMDAVPDKSIAVLPFENLNKDKENAFFAAGIQDDVLTSLAQIHELKVISRTSVMAYQKHGERNMREISQALGVANILEGSVRRTGNRVLVNVQLIDARNDRHIWAERYDRTVADSIGLQGELATQIAATLKAKLAPEEKARLEAKPTDNPEAYALYLEARGRAGTVNLSFDDVTAAMQLYGQAIALDPKFALAHAGLSIMSSYLAHTPSGNRAVRTTARMAAEDALRLAPTLGEVHMAHGLYLYWFDKDYTNALKELSVAAATSPNEPDLFYFISGIHRAQGRWHEAAAATQRAQDRDPLNRETFLRAADDHLFVRDWAGGAACYERALKLSPDSADATISLAYIAVFRDGNPGAGRKLLQTIPRGIDPDGITTESRWDMAMLERDYAGAEKILQDSVVKDFPRSREGAKDFFAGRTARARGDFAAAERYFAAAAPAFEARVRDAPDDSFRRAELGQLYAYMQRAEDAIREGRRAVALEPESRDAFLGAKRSANLALVYALLGKADEAIPLLDHLLSAPGSVDWPDSPQSITLADLRLRQEWDPLRSNPRFQKILAGPEPKTVY